MSDDVFDAQRLSEKLSKLNSSQQSIESLSRWCILHRKKAKHIVEIWDKSFSCAQGEQHVAFLYLANDILQNSRRKGSEFVNEFWKVLPIALKLVNSRSDDHGKKAALRLVGIWEERRVFGSRGQNLKDELLGKDPPASVSSGKSSNLIKTIKMDAHSLRIKLSVGDMPEKILTAFQSVYDENITEEAALIKCKDAVSLVENLGKDVENVCTQGKQHGSTLLDKIQEKEDVLQQCVKELESAKSTRSSLVSQLNEALDEQELKLEFIGGQLQAARGLIEQMSSIRQRLTSPHISALPSCNNVSMEADTTVEPNLPTAQQTSTMLLSSVQPTISFASLRTSEEENKKAAAAAVAAKLAASTSSAQMLTSVLSSLVAEEAAMLNGGLKSSACTAGLPLFPPEKRPKLDKPLTALEGNNCDMGTPGYLMSLQQQLTNMPIVPSTTMQTLSQANNQVQAPFPPPPPPVHSASSAADQFVQSAGLMMGAMPYGFDANNLPPPPPPPPPLSSHMTMGLVKASSQLPQQQQAQSQQLLHTHQKQQQSQHPQQQATNGGYYRPPGIGFFGQTHQPRLPVPRR